MPEFFSNLLYYFFSPLALVICVLSVYQSIKYREAIRNNKRILLSYHRIYNILLQNLDFNVFAQQVADTIPNELDFGTGVLSIIDENKGVLKRVTASRTTEASTAVSYLDEIGIPFKSIEIPVRDNFNLMSRSLREKRSFVTSNVYDVFRPILTQEQSNMVQKLMKTKTTFVYPIFMGVKPVGVFIASTKKGESQISAYEYEILNNFVSLIGLSLQNSKLFTSLQQTTKELEDANKRLQEVDKLKDDFVSIASHELRTPMTAIRSYVWMALYKPDIDLSERMKKYLSRTLTSTERLIKLVNDMLNVSRIESGRVEVIPSVFNMQEMLKEVVSELTPRAQEKSINIVVDPEEVPKIFADQDKVHQILLNIIGNALKFTPFEGKIEVNFFSDGITLETSIKDNGVGISKDDIGRLFRKFGRLDNSYVAAATSGGTGLGLYISKSLVELMKGTIKVYSDGIGKGTTFTFSLPVATPKVLADVQKYTYLVKEGEAKPLEPAAI